MLYSLVPWIGVMAAGYAFGKVLTLDAARRNRLCLALGLGGDGALPRCCAASISTAIRAPGRPRQRKANAPMPALFAFLNTSKYPASLLFLLMTLGPTIALVPVLEGRTGRARPLDHASSAACRSSSTCSTFPLIHALALVVSKMRLGEVSPWLFANHPMGNPPAPEGYVWGLGLLYVVWAAVIVLLYVPCRWFAD